MPKFISTLRELVRQSIQAQSDAAQLAEAASLQHAITAIRPTTTSGGEVDLRTDPLDRERIISERLSELSDSVGIRYRQVCKDLRDPTRLAWTGDAHELRDILATVLRTLAPTEEVVAQKWYKPVENTTGPTHAQRARYILLQVQSQDDAKESASETDLIDELVSRIARSTYTSGSQLAHTKATHADCVRLLFQFDALMFSLLNASPNDANSS